MSAYQAGQRAWPGVPLDAARFDAFVSGRGPLDDTQAAELYLACACVAGAPQAHAAFDATYLSEIAAALAHMKLPAASVDEVRQAVRVKLLVAPPGGVPRIAEVAGRGQLHGLVRVAAVRLAIDLLRKGERELLVGEQGELDVSASDVELDFIKSGQRQAFKQAFEATLAGLEPRQRTILRLHNLDGLTVEQIAQSYGVNRSTVTRWITELRQELLAGTRRRLEAQGLDDVAAIFRDIESKLELSLHRLLRTSLH